MNLLNALYHWETRYSIIMTLTGKCSSQQLQCYKCLSTNHTSAQGLSNHERSCRGQNNHGPQSKKKRHIDYMTSTSDGRRQDFVKQPISFLLNKRQKKESDDTGPNPADNEEEEDSSDDEPRRECDEYFEGDAMARYYNDSDSESDHAVEYEPETTGATYQPTNDPTKIPAEEAQPAYNQSGVGLPGAWKFSIDLAEICGGSRTDLSLFGKINDLIRQHSNGSELKFSSENLPTSRSKFINDLEESFETKGMRPEDVPVKLASGAEATVAVFNLEKMILSLLHDESLMKPENLAEGYDIFTGKSTQPETHYGEIHTGDAWEEARKHFCGDDPNSQFMPIALIIFGDKSHSDLHGVLSTTPICFTLSCFNETARNSVDFWRPMAYIPNLNYGKLSGKDKTSEDEINPTTSLEDEHACILASLQSLIQLTKEGGIATKIKGRAVICKVWIHFIIGDIEGNNKWLGHYGNNGKTAHPYRDCTCSYSAMKDADPTCTYITPAYVEAAKAKGTKVAMKRISKHDIDNAFMAPDVPLSDQVHGIYRMFPPELLHTTTEGTSPYMCQVFNKMLGLSDDPVSCRHVIDMIHSKFHASLSRNSERDFPRSSNRTGFLKGTQINATERQGNMFILLCICHMTEIQRLLSPLLVEINSSLDELIHCLKMYLAMEAWFHGKNSKDEVRAARPLIAEVIELVQKVFERTEGQGWNIPKMHGLTKMQYYMCLFGSAMNFYGGPGECNHKKFVKDTANNTQHQISTFVSQLALRYYETMLFEIAKEAANKRFKKRYELIDKATDEARVILTGSYTLKMKAANHSVTHPDYSLEWKHEKKNKQPFDLKARVVDTIIKFVKDAGWDDRFVATGFTCLSSDLHGRTDLFRCTNSFHLDREEWYDWCMIEYDYGTEAEPSTVVHPSKIHCFIQFNTEGMMDDSGYDKDQVFVVIQSSKDPLSLSTLESEFIANFELGCDPNVDYKVVPIDSIVEPLMVFGKSPGCTNEYCCALPKRKWGRYFGDKVQV